MVQTRTLKTQCWTFSCDPKSSSGAMSLTRKLQCGSGWPPKLLGPRERHAGPGRAVQSDFSSPPTLVVEWVGGGVERKITTNKSCQQELSANKRASLLKPGDTRPYVAALLHTTKLETPVRRIYAKTWHDELIDHARPAAPLQESIRCRICPGHIVSADRGNQDCGNTRKVHGFSSITVKLACRR